MGFFSVVGMAVVGIAALWLLVKFIRAAMEMGFVTALVGFLIWVPAKILEGIFSRLK